MDDATDDAADKTNKEYLSQARSPYKAKVDITKVRLLVNSRPGYDY